MTTMDVTVTATGNTIANAGLPWGAAGLVNTGADTIWVDSTQVLGPVGTPITAGSSQPWPEGTQLYAWCPTTSHLMVTSIPDQGVNAGGIASQLITQGLAGQIATAIYNQGTRSLGGQTIVSTDTVATTPGNVPNAGPVLDMRAYASAIITITETASTGASTRLQSLAWYADAALTQIVAFENVTAFTSLGTLRITTPCVGSYLQLSSSAAATVAGTNITRTVIGSLTAVPKVSTYCNAGNLTGGSGLLTQTTIGMASMAGTVTATTKTDYPSCTRGPASLYIRVTGGASGTSAVDLADLGDNRAYYRQDIAASAAIQTFWVPSLILSGSAVRLQLTNAGGAATIAASLQMTT